MLELQNPSRAAVDLKALEMIADDFATMRSFEMAHTFMVKAMAALRRVAQENTEALQHELDRTESARAAAVREIEAARLWNVNNIKAEREARAVVEGERDILQIKLRDTERKLRRFRRACDAAREHLQDNADWASDTGPNAEMSVLSEMDGWTEGYYALPRGE